MISCAVKDSALGRAIEHLLVASLILASSIQGFQPRRSVDERLCAFYGKAPDY